jgi:hypothetical protein
VKFQHGLDRTFNNCVTRQNGSNARLSLTPTVIAVAAIIAASATTSATLEVAIVPVSVVPLASFIAVTTAASTTTASPSPTSRTLISIIVVRTRLPSAGFTFFVDVTFVAYFFITPGVVIGLFRTPRSACAPTRRSRFFFGRGSCFNGLFFHFRFSLGSLASRGLLAARCFLAARLRSGFFRFLENHVRCVICGGTSVLGS